jgi:hypothetical protein
MSLFDELLTAQISLKVRGTDSLLQAIYMQAAITASLERPLISLFL